VDFQPVATGVNQKTVNPFYQQAQNLKLCLDIKGKIATKISLYQLTKIRK